jgi:lipopolysaccharide/colanic/teichoic acid biosynthesis glycosyltransferase
VKPNHPLASSNSAGAAAVAFDRHMRHTDRLAQIAPGKVSVSMNRNVIRAIAEPTAVADSYCGQSRAQAAVKRFLDVTISLSLLLALLPLFLVISMAIKLTSEGPIFYRWKVVGQHGWHFVSYKFRSMVANADELRPSLESRNEMRGPVFKITNDPRITRVGRLLRKYSLDELPQLWSVLIGDMSLVGPRPPLQTEYVRFTEYQKLKLQVKPGLTCLWQIRGRNEVRDLDDWVKLDLLYVQHWSLALDLRIVLRTIPVVFFGKGK